MADMRGGGCLCGRVRYKSAGEPLFSLLCHCRDRQHQSGSAKISVCHGVGGMFAASGTIIMSNEPT